MTGRNDNDLHPGRCQADRFLLGRAELITFKIRSQGYSVFENATQVGYGGPPPHRHLRQDEGFYVLDGQFTFNVDGRVVSVSAGQFVSVPRGSLHTFQTTGTGVGRLLVIVAPSGDFEHFVEDVGERVSMTLPPAPPTAPPDAASFRRLVAAAEQHHIEMLPLGGMRLR